MHKNSLDDQGCFCFIFFSLIYRTPALRRIRIFLSVSAYSIAYFSEDQEVLLFDPTVVVIVRVFIVDSSS